MSHLPFFSIIVPVYNVEDYLEACIESVLAQNFHDYEMILVDDGSPDSSGSICDRYAAQYPQIKVIHQENQGLSGARNTGLRAACGTYILFLDSDDFYPQNTFLQELHNHCHGEDLLLFNYSRYTDQLQSPMIHYPELSGTNDNILLTLVGANAYTSSACTKAVRRELLIDHSVFFEIGTLSEDIEWSAGVLMHAHSASVIPDNIYAYRVRSNSISRTMSGRHLTDLVRIVSRMADKTAVGSAQLQEAYLSFTAFQYCTILINIHLCKEKPGKQTIRQIKALSWLLRHDTNKIVKLVHLAFRLSGFHITSWLLYFYFRMFYW